MAYSIVKDDCVNCGACEGECPVDAISEKDDARVIDADTCIDCGACVDVCPTECINPA
ncbi:indolepyruvate ferredoxin oxidoreductase subunit alpha [Spirochaeta isovalerica]|uniref:indolepyruvate ferredoxin oxidoreductase subunit alpha n=1 Tax=Spirochaeta isovalerica TaxID=150 RepID=UPI001618B168|nr:4Fe-4S binding protein [Spirochaeta isovalerica]